MNGRKVRIQVICHTWPEKNSKIWSHVNISCDKAGHMQQADIVHAFTIGNLVVASNLISHWTKRGGNLCLTGQQDLDLLKIIMVSY